MGRWPNFNFCRRQATAAATATAAHIPTSSITFQQALATITLDATQRTIIEERYVHLLDISRARCRRMARLFHLNRSIVTLGSILVPALLSIQHVDIGNAVPTYNQGVFWTTWILSLLVTASNGIMTMFKLDKKYYLLHASYEQLKSEGWQYIALTGKYRRPPPLTDLSGALIGAASPGPHQIHFELFAQTVERIRMRQMEEEYIRLQDLSQQAGTAVSHGTSSANAIPNLIDINRTPARDDLIRQVAVLVSAELQETAQRQQNRRTPVEGVAPRALHADETGTTTRA